MDPKQPRGTDMEREGSGRDESRKPDAHASEAERPGMDRMRQPIEQRERESEQRKNGELTEE